MSDYINRKDLIDALNDTIRKSDMPFEWCQGMANAGYIIMHQPSADVVEVIRCKDCKHRPFDKGYEIEFPDEKCPCQCEDGWYNWRPNNEWFCANAERRTDE